MTTALPEHLLAVRERWRAAAREERDLLYAREFGPAFAPLFAQLPLRDAPAELEQPEALISVLGLSWQPVALMAAWCRPRRVLVIGSDGPEGSLDRRVGEEGVLDVIARVSGVDRSAFEPVRVGDADEAQIYRHVRDFLRASGISSRRVFVDPTGGKKSMSASTALAAFVLGAPLAYVDHAEYDPAGRIPMAGTEYPRLLTNPLQVLGDVAFRDVFAAFNRGDFQECHRLAAALADRLLEPREAECLAELARGYAAWDRFDFKAARNALEGVAARVEKYDPRASWSWTASIRNRLKANLEALAGLESIPKEPESIDQGVPLLLWYLSKSRRHLDSGNPSLAVLLAYACVERYVDLNLWVRHKLKDDEPDYALIGTKLDKERYRTAGKAFFGKDYKERELEGPLMMGNGLQLLHALNPDLVKLEDIGELRGLSNARNKCEYEHGLLPVTPKPQDGERYLKRAELMVARNAKVELDPYRFPLLPEFS